MSSSTTIRRSAFVAAVALAIGSALASPAPAQAAEPVVTVTGTHGRSVSESDCKGASRSEVFEPIRVTVSRTGDASGPLSVLVDYQGSLAGSSGLPSPITFTAGQTDVTFEADEATSGNLTVSLIDGDGYAVGSPGGALLYVDQAIADLGCGIGNVHTAQTIDLGSTPAAIDVEKVAYNPPDSLARSIEGNVPPGLTFHLDGTWSGVATELGTFSFSEYFCQPDGWCPYRASITITVVEAGEDPDDSVDDPAPPAAAAQAVAGTPELTG